jgi:aminoglycoside phosphotransferase (APT) family kinase protein
LHRRSVERVALLRLLPRIFHVPVPARADDLWPPAASRALVEDLPDDILTTTGEIRHISYPGQSRRNLLLRLDADNGQFVLKAARGPYRGWELWTEHVMMQDLSETAIPVPDSLAFIQDQELYLQLRQYVRGTPLNAMLEDSETSNLGVLRQVGRTLAAIHRLGSPVWTWQEWLDASLSVAEQNIDNGVIDPDRFSEEESPSAVLEWLRDSRPDSGSVVLLHGDFRVENLLWRAGQIVAVLDWAFADFGDPYYDLATVLEAAQDQVETRHVLAGYGMSQPDFERLYYFHQLAKFLCI